MFYCRYELEFSICFWTLKRPPKRDKNSNSSHDFERCLLKTFNCLPSSTNSRITCLGQFFILFSKSYRFAFEEAIALIFTYSASNTSGSHQNCFLLIFRKVCFLIINSHTVGIGIYKLFSEDYNMSFNLTNINTSDLFLAAILLVTRFLHFCFISES